MHHSYRQDAAASSENEVAVQAKATNNVSRLLYVRWGMGGGSYRAEGNGVLSDVCALYAGCEGAR